MTSGPDRPTLFAPDSPLAERVHPSPNQDERPAGRRPGILLLHYTGMTGWEDALARLCDPAAEVSSHYFVFEDGRIWQLVPENRRAWHAGAGAWAGARDINARSVGIEIVNGGHAGGLPAYPPVQIEAVRSLCLDVMSRLSIAPRHVLAHSDTAPARKEDPGELFPWRELAQAGIGVWAEAKTGLRASALGPGDRGDGVAALQRDLGRWGYDCPETGLYDEATRLVVAAFQRHFRPERVDGIADGPTSAMLAALLATHPPSALPD